ncbi:MAG: M24 family metallopeptidase, partial [Patescibacteria group bacterium]|nr:M24 family metallopeptidase [Patescibacteria group bacterium]
DKLRIKKLQTQIKNPILIKKPENLAYLIGRSFMRGYLLVKKTEIVFLGDGLEKAEGVAKTDFLKNVGRYIKPKETLELFGEFTYNETEYIKFKNPKLKLKVTIKHSPVDSERQVKDTSELFKVRKSMEIVNAVFNHTRKQLKRRAWTEKALAEFIQNTGLRLGAEDLSFPAIVASGANAAVPHHVPGGKKIRAGEPVIIDFGFKYKKYCSDFTRTIFLNRVPKKMELAYNQVEQAYLESIAAAEPGMPAGKLCDLAVSKLAQKKLDKYFIHSLGHGTGLEIHELPNLSPGSKDTLVANMVFSIG